jgi:phosphoglycolate phosphatase
MIRAVLFDLDGTLLDTAPDLVGALNQVRQAEDLPAVAVEDYRHFASRGALGLITAGMPMSSEEIFEQRKSIFLDYYQQNIYLESRLFDGIENLLKSLDQRAVPWGVITNKLEYLTLPVLSAAGLLHRAGCVVCGDTLRQSKPHPAPVLLGCELLGVNNDNVLMVGDDIRDLQAGQGAGTQTALALYGYIEPGIFDRDLSGSHLVQKPGDVLDLLGVESSAR